ncbi:unnamed protein product, partial [Rotaria sp. Silwood1]
MFNIGLLMDAGARVHVMLYKEMSFALALNSLYTETKLVSKSTKVIRHPGHNTKYCLLLWFHHEKTVVIHQKTAFIGGIDFCYGRWDDEFMRHVDVGDAYDTTLKLPSDIAAENEPSADTETIEAVQMVTTYMAEQAGEAPIK